MINTPKKIEYSEVFNNAVAQIDKASAITTMITELKSLYANKSKIESITELSVSGAGLKFTITEKDDAFGEFISTMIHTITSKIAQKEKDVYNVLNDKVIEVQPEA
jgi:hypothetical protein